MSWSPDVALGEHADLLMQRHTGDLLRARDRVIKECAADAAKRGMLRSGQHLAEVCEKWEVVLQEHGSTVLADLISAVERFAELTPDSAYWIQSQFDRHIDRLSAATASGLVDRVNQLRIGHTDTAEALEGRIHRSGDRMKGKAALRLRLATSEAALGRRQAHVGETEEERRAGSPAHPPPPWWAKLRDGFLEEAGKKGAQAGAAVALILAVALGLSVDRSRVTSVPVSSTPVAPTTTTAPSPPTEPLSGPQLSALKTAKRLAHDALTEPRIIG